MADAHKRDRAAARALCEAATPGPWRLAGTAKSPCPVVTCHDAAGYQIHSMLHVKRDYPDTWKQMRPTYVRDAAFIAHFNPQFCLQLLDALDAAERARDAALAEAQQCRLRMKGELGPYADLTTEQAHAVHTERDALCALAQWAADAIHGHGHSILFAPIISPVPNCKRCEFLTAAAALGIVPEAKEGE